MEAKSEEYAAYRLHRRMRFEARLCFYYNLAYENYLIAAFYGAFWLFEIAASRKHQARLHKRPVLRPVHAGD